ncbi:LON peptidase N-terminal domain and ring finger 1, like isoform X2 [Carcharodon carcharias]|uniref:LON peptidase N-terminal domain and ring finger 1, like isoform X2 n=1 Tax=Carcharodon carcharias TaxID=13397 RepID=UPI001B7EC5A3|nr:LON peptidase N-terminal domain and ring finger 1, like isoform X2 [Carcharodon carcharias]
MSAVPSGVMESGRIKPRDSARLVAGSCGTLQPEQLGGLVQCLLYHFKRGEQGDGAGISNPEPGHPGAGGGLLDCGGCREPLAEPVTLRCGHTWCRRCLWKSPRCPGCGEAAAADIQSLRPNVILSHLMAKWFPAEVRRTRDKIKLEELVAQCRFPEALTLLEQLELKPSDVALQSYRAESYAGLQLFKEAIEDMEAVCSRRPAWPEGYFRKARVLYTMGLVDEAVQSFLQCLALDEDFTPAKVEVEKILCDLLSPVLENVKGCLHIRNKDLPDHLSTNVGCFRMTPNSTELKGDEISYVPNSAEGELACPSWTQSVQLLHRVENLVGLKRISSAPLLSCQEKAVLMKRKLSFSDQEIRETDDGKSKHQKQDTEQLFHSSSSERTITKDLIDASDFECSLCMRLFLEPITTPCGHTFCKGCLERSLDHNPLCPLCKDSLKEYLENRKYAVTYLLEEMIARYLSEELCERQRVHNEETAELSNLTKNVPIFVCTMAYPTVPCPLHVFEPRYRLMIRRCIETGTKQFGMCISDPHNGFTDYGCMLHIRNIHFLPDGRSIVDTVGGSCFKVLERGQKDGYYIANIEYLKDVKVTGEELDKLVDLHDEVYAQACKWFQNLKSRFHIQILQHFGPMPERETDLQGPPNGPAWCWWLLAVLPVDPKYQLSVLSMTSLKNRLIKIQKILTYFSSARDQSK